MGRRKAVIRLRWVYEPSSQEEGLRILVERLWSPGVSKKSAAIDLWLNKMTTKTRSWDSMTTGSCNSDVTIMPRSV